MDQESVDMISNGSILILTIVGLVVVGWMIELIGDLYDEYKEAQTFSKDDKYHHFR